jgi:hypothetical protein
MEKSVEPATSSRWISGRCRKPLFSQSWRLSRLALRMLFTTIFMISVRAGRTVKKKTKPQIKGRIRHLPPHPSTQAYPNQFGREACLTLGASSPNRSFRRALELCHRPASLPFRWFGRILLGLDQARSIRSVRCRRSTSFAPSPLHTPSRHDGRYLYSVKCPFPALPRLRGHL